MSDAVVTELWRRRRWLGVCAALAGGLAGRSAQAAPGGLPTGVGHADSSPQWELLRSKLFGDRAIQASPGQIKLIVPLRAAYGASVPVKVQAQIPQTEGLHVKRLTLLVDKNPSPVAAQLELSTALGQADFETRLRVDEYSHVRVVAELSNGELHTDSRYVKVSGGCSAPPNREAPELIGRTTLRLPEGLHPGAPTPVDLTVMHPNDTGFELNQITLLYIPSHFVRSVRVAYGGRPLFQAETDFSISENPSWRFRFMPRDAGVLTAEVDDSRERHYSGSLDPHAAASAVAAS
jgi:sulfur-oxidizing protein SoxY